MRTYAQRQKIPQMEALRQRSATAPGMSNQAMLGMLNEPSGDTRFSEALRAKFAPKRAPNADEGKPLPDALRKKYEEKSGLPMDDVRVHYNSDEPEKLDALAYTYGNEVYIGPGQEKHLEHELGHVVQQKQGVVKSIKHVNGIPLNDSESLETSADTVRKHNEVKRQINTQPIVQRCGGEGSNKTKAAVINTITTKAQNFDLERGICHDFTYDVLSSIDTQIAKAVCGVIASLVNEDQGIKRVYQALLMMIDQESEVNGGKREWWSKITEDTAFPDASLLLFGTPPKTGNDHHTIEHSMIVSNGSPDVIIYGVNNIGHINGTFETTGKKGNVVKFIQRSSEQTYTPIILNTKESLFAIPLISDGLDVDAFKAQLSSTASNVRYRPLDSSHSMLTPSKRPCSLQ